MYKRLPRHSVSTVCIDSFDELRECKDSRWALERSLSRSESLLRRLQPAAGSGLRNLQLFLSHIDGDVGKERSAQVALARVRQHAENRRFLGRLGGHTQSCGECPAGGDAHEDAFLASELPTPTHRFCIWNAQDLADPVRRHRVRCYLGD